MDAKTFGQVALRVLAVYLIAVGITSFPTLLDVLWQKAAPADLKLDYRVFAVSLALPFFIGLAVWIFAPRLSRWMASGASEQGSTDPLDAPRLQTIALTTLGVVLALHGLSDLAINVAEGGLDSPSIFTIMWGELLTLLMGVALILGGKFFTRWFKRLRELGTE